jgi:quercetin dioxygenase-like cupin family protein
MRVMFPVAVALTAFAAFAQDVVQLAPDRVKVVFENDRVRVLQFNEPGHSKLPMHSHPAYVAVGFTTDDFKYTFPDGKTSNDSPKAGEVAYSKAITHASENLSDSESEAVMVELKQPGGGTTAPKTTLDPVKLDSKHYKVVFNNDQVRVLRARYGPHEKSVMHEHPASVAVFMTDGHSKFTLPDGTSQDRTLKAHDAMWADAGKHLPENVGDKSFEVIVIELKR